MKRQYMTPALVMCTCCTESLVCVSLARDKATDLDGLDYGGGYTGTVTADAKERLSGGCDDDDLW